MAANIAKLRLAPARSPIRARPDRAAVLCYAAVGDLKRMNAETPRRPQVTFFCPDPAAGLEKSPLA